MVSGLLTSILSSLLTSIVSSKMSSLLTSIHCIRSSMLYFVSSCCSHLLPDYRKKFKTKVLKDSSNPEWNEQFVFDHLKLEDLRKNRVIELTVWNSTKNTKHYDFIGGLRLGPRPHHKKQLSYMDSSENELSHWMSVVNTPGECVITHTLRHNMNPLPVTLSVDETVDDINDAVIDEDIKCTPNFVLTHPDDSTDVFTTNQLPIITVKDDDNVSCFSQQVSHCHQTPYIWYTIPAHALHTLFVLYQRTL